MTKQLTEKQQEIYEILVRLGDSKELAFKTALAEKVKDNSEYHLAYYS
jgi:hypothetical protein